MSLKMDAPATDIQSILAALKGAAQQPAPSAPYSQSMPPATANSYPPPSTYPPPNHTYAAPYAPPGQPPMPYGYPAPSASGSIDLSSIRPSASGAISIEQAIAQAKSLAAEQGIKPYERPAGYVHNDRGPDGRQYRRSRSRSPRRDNYRDNYNGFRDERRDQRDRSYSPGPRGRSNFSPRGAQARERSPLRGKDENLEMMEIESSLVGLIIGRQGENLRRIEGETHCRVQFLPASGPNEPMRHCKITGPPARRAEARAAIEQIIQDSGLSGGGSRSGGHFARDMARAPSSDNAPAVLKEGEATIKIMVPDRTVGLIIGRGGETIRDLQERSQCHINIVSENKSVNGLRPVNLIGSTEATKMAKDLIMEIVDSDSRNVNNQGGGRPSRNDGPRDMGMGTGMGGGGKVNDSIFVPSEAVGMIIGKGGETIREMQNTTGCKINVSQTGDIEREVGLVGPPDAIQRAKQAIQEKVDAVNQKGSGGGGRRHRDYDSPGYGQSNDHNAAQNVAPTASDSAAAAADPYAAYGGYNAYVALWYSAMASQSQAQANRPGDANQSSAPPGT